MTCARIRGGCGRCGDVIVAGIDTRESATSVWNADVIPGSRFRSIGKSSPRCTAPGEKFRRCVVALVVLLRSYRRRRRRLCPSLSSIVCCRRLLIFALYDMLSIVCLALSTLLRVAPSTSSSASSLATLPMSGVVDRCSPRRYRRL